MKASSKAGVLMGIFTLGAGVLSAAVHAADRSPSGAAASNDRHAGPKVIVLDFSKFADRKWKVGDKFTGDHGRIEFKEFFRPDGEASQAEGQQATVVDTTYARGVTPELKTYLINVRFVPNAPVQRVTLKFAENHKYTNADLEVNGEKQTSKYGVQDFDGKMIGGARVTVAKNPGPAGEHPSGKLELVGVHGKIQSFAVGAREGRFDDLRLEK